MDSAKMIFLLLALVFLPAFNIRAECKTEPLSRRQFEEKFGKPVACHPESFTGLNVNKESVTVAAERLTPDSTCYKTGTQNFSAAYDSDDELKSLVVYAHQSDFNRLLFSLIPDSWMTFRQSIKKNKLRIDDRFNAIGDFSDDCLEFEAGYIYFPRGAAPPGCIFIDWR